MAADAANADLMGDDNGGGNGDGAGDKSGGGGKAGADGGGGTGDDGGDKGSGDGAGDDGDLLGDDPPADDKGKKPDDKKPDDKAAELTIEVPKELADFADKEALEDFTKLAKDQKLSKEQANAIAKQAFERAKAHHEAVTKRMADTNKAWHDEIKNDKEIGGDNIPETKQDIALAIAKYAPPGFVKLAKDLGVHNWPPLVKMMKAIGKDLRPDGGKIPGAKGGSAGTETHEQMLARIYGTD